MSIGAEREEGRWKDKYFDQLDLMEKKEKSWGELEAVLKKAVGRVSLAAEGQAESIDCYLKQIRAAVKNEVDHYRLETILEDLSKRLARAEAPDKRVISALQAVVDSLSLGASAERLRQKVLKQLAESSDADKDACIEGIRELLQKSLAASNESSDEGKKQPGVIGRILGKCDEVAPVEVCCENVAVDDAGIDNSSADIRELLIRLLEQLVVPADFHGNIEEMKARLSDSADASDWGLLKEAASLINSIPVHMQKEKHEFESFLHQVTTRLNQMDSYLQNESNSIESAEQQGRLFDDNLSWQVNDIRDDMKQASNLDDLKVAVEGRLEAMSRHIKEYRSAEKKRYSSAKKDVLDMQNQMMAMEKQSQELKAIIIEKNRQAMFDALTGIPNRLAYERKLEEEIARWKRFDKPLCLIVWDIDLFKQVNDTYGHKAGDKVLKKIARVMHDRIRETDFLARFGGEEFVMLLPDTTEAEAVDLANELRQQIESCGFHYQRKAVAITVSCGISIFRDGDVATSVFERADRALYQAKDDGRNCCVLAAA